jgi:hypothetical protein
MSTKTEKVKVLLSQLFGPKSANHVDVWLKEGISDDQVVAKAKAKVTGFLGPKKALHGSEPAA